MPQIFHRSTNTLSRLSIFGAVFLIGALLWVVAEINRSSYVTQAFVAKEQPVQFSHRHHVGDDGIDCRYCHTTVERTASAGMPSTKTCMNCHSQLFADAPYLEPIRESWRTEKPIRWTRVHDLPDYAYFNHSIHVNKGVGCATCHGRIDLMPSVWQVSSLQMEWCLECHREPERFVRPKDQVFNMEWQPPANQIEEGKKLVEAYHIQSSSVLTSCSTCHR
ncbi:MAG TPA: cytochrome c3 family protein [Blastocatellia bacterium]|nr:cytochrome c3 family protein [Blastocatellia bacterium]